MWVFSRMGKRTTHWMGMLSLCSPVCNSPKAWLPLALQDQFRPFPLIQGVSIFNPDQDWLLTLLNEQIQRPIFTHAFHKSKSRHGSKGRKKVCRFNPKSTPFSANADMLVIKSKKTCPFSCNKRPNLSRRALQLFSKRFWIQTSKVSLAASSKANINGANIRHESAIRFFPG